MRGTIVCGVDDSREAEAAAVTAAQLSERLDLRLVLAHVVEDVSPPLVGGDGLGVRQALGGAKKLLARVAAAADAADDVDERIEFGDPVDQLAEVATEEVAELVVVGARRRRLGPHIGRGVAARLAATTLCPVLVAPRESAVRGDEDLAARATR